MGLSAHWLSLETTTRMKEMMNPACIPGREKYMYITRFTRADQDKTTEDYLYQTEQEAKDHLLLFQNDDSGLYRNVAVIDDENCVRHILPFVDGKPTDVISAGSCVKLRPEYSSPEEIEKDDVFIVTNMNEWSGRINITCLTSDMVLKPTETVGVEMVCPMV